MLIFLDAHMVVTKNWIEPLLEYVRDHPTSVAASIIDVLQNGRYHSNGLISLVTLLYKQLQFKWYKIILGL